VIIPLFKRKQNRFLASWMPWKDDCARGMRGLESALKMAEPIAKKML